MSEHKTRAIIKHKFVTDLDKIKVSEVDRPIPNSDEYLIQVKAAGVNFVDILYVKGKHQNNRALVRPPFVLGLEFAGVILSAPPHAHFLAGERVFGAFPGSYSETLPEAAGIAATLPVSYASLLRAGLKPGQTVLVHAAAGGLGLMAVQVATAMGCRAIGTAGSWEKCAVAAEFGAQPCLNYTQEPAWWERVLELTEHKGVDVVFDPVGLVDRSLKCIAHRGKVLVIGFAGIDDKMEHIAMNRVLLKQASLIGYRYGESLRRYPGEQKMIWDELHSLIESNKIQPAIFRTSYHGPDQVPRALKDMANRKIWGKAVVTLDSSMEGTSRARI
ncbi:Putative GroES-like superfamily, alcohol dehydrogenase-like, NAD(P)-binding domain superfamily [Colletotrichum destructivum]|uniref:GroES-like superfamily, alcohol dehydrogenase-like, NAD(P)-binding domain superfamily n=1 Tax=Colletotrichum destructivum TaxID=34406 RepID=A0AAX4IXN6_9PEZI|nr:Putative GroES-like superfamily, alcohol dehydrogenase-like, NAD(P)-binding domain superfamily [Colletotrichum destructivum]